jgi:hypothetical protein
MVEAVDDRCRHTRPLHRGGEQSLDVRWWGQQHRVRPAGHPPRIVPIRIKGRLHPGRVERLLAVGEDAV